MSVVAWVNDIPRKDYHRRNDVSRVSFKIDNSTDVGNIFGAATLSTTRATAALLDALSRSFRAAVAKEFAETEEGADSHQGSPGFDEEPLQSPGDINYVRAMPYLALADLLDALEALGVFLYPVALSIPLPILVYLLASEKDNRLREIQRVHGMSMVSYYASLLLHGGAVYAFSALFLAVGGIAISLRFFSQTSPWVLFLFFAG